MTDGGRVGDRAEPALTVTPRVSARPSAAKLSPRGGAIETESSAGRTGPSAA